MEVNKWLDDLLTGKSRQGDKVKEYEDVIDEESGYNQLDSILAGSNETIRKVNEYISKNHERSEAYDKSLLNTAENFYIEEGKAYYMNKDQWAQVQGIINDCNNLKVLEKTLGKSPNISYKYKQIYIEAYESIKKMKETVYTNILNNMAEGEVTLIIRKVLNVLLIEHFKQSEVSEFLIPYKQVCILLGIELCNLYLTNNLSYEPESEGYEPDVTSKGEKVIRPGYRADQENYNKILTEIIEKIKDGSISITDYKKLHIEIIHTKEFEYINAAIIIQRLLKKEEESELSVEDYNTKVKAQEVTLSMAYHLGEIIINKLISQKMFIIEVDGRKVPQLKLGQEDLQLELTASAVFTKPMLMNEMVTTSAKHKVQNNVTFTLKTKSSLVKHDSNVKLYPKPKLEEILSHMTQYKIAINNYEDFLRYIEKIIDLPFDKDNESIQAFLWVYNLDFKEILENTAHSELVERLMRFGLKIDILFDKDLLKACKLKKSESCLRMYNMIISYKYYLKGLLNDIAIFMRFNYFYLARSITSTGRTLTIPYFLNLQNFKLTKAFVIMHKVRRINENNYEKVKGAVMDEIKTPTLREELESISYEKYEEKTKELMRTYIQDFLKDKTEFDKYPLDKTYREQIDWLSTQCKKPREIFYARLLYNSFYHEQDLSLIYELDATSSGLQIIAMMQKDEDICFLSNVIGTKYTDIYSMYISEFQVQIKRIDEYLREYYKVLGISLNIEPKDTEVTNMTNFKEVFLLFINTRPEEIANEMINKLYRSIRSISKEKLIYLQRRLPYSIYTWIIDHSKNIAKDTAYKDILNTIRIKSTALNKDRMKAMENLIYIHAMSGYFVSVGENPWLEKTKSLNKRQLSKLPIMALPYSMGSSGRVDALTKYFIDEANLNGYDIDIKTLNPIIRTLDRYFSVFQRRHLSNATKFLDIIKTYIEHHIPFDKTSTVPIHENISIDTEYIKWVFSPYETVMKRLSLSKHRLAIYKHTGYMSKSLANTSFSAIFIHSADAYVVYKYIEITKNIENNLNSKSMIKVGVFTNHDNFGISHEYSPFLKLILKECYNQFADSNYIGNLRVTTTEAELDIIKAYKLIYCTNDHFVKH